MNEYSMLMGLIDFLPVLLFLIAAVILQRSLYDYMSKGAFALFAAGTIDIVIAGLLKALYKLLYAMEICDFERLNQMFFPVQALGFLLAGLGVFAMVSFPQKTGKKLYAVGAPAVFSGTFVFVGMMVLGAAFLNFGLASVAFKKRKKLTGFFFVLTFFGELAMGYLSSRDFTSASANWTAQIVNSVGQGLFMLAAFGLSRSVKAKAK